MIELPTMQTIVDVFNRFFLAEMLKNIFPPLFGIAVAGAAIKAVFGGGHR
ncbi:MAG TPA: hypothetical protein V6C97_26425 [Oculatellaceae cyanobacterium]